MVGGDPVRKKKGSHTSVPLTIRCSLPPLARLPSLRPLLSGYPPSWQLACRAADTYPGIRGFRDTIDQTATSFSKKISKCLKGGDMMLEKIYIPFRVYEPALWSFIITSLLHLIESTWLLLFCLAATLSYRHRCAKKINTQQMDLIDIYQANQCTGRGIFAFVAANLSNSKG